jgi:hypothetical protein
MSDEFDADQVDRPEEFVERHERQLPALNSGERPPDIVSQAAVEGMKFPRTVPAQGAQVISTYDVRPISGADFFSTGGQVNKTTA